MNLDRVHYLGLGGIETVNLDLVRLGPVGTGMKMENLARAQRLGRGGVGLQDRRHSDLHRGTPVQTLLQKVGVVNRSQDHIDWEAQRGRGSGSSIARREVKANHGPRARARARVIDGWGEVREAQKLRRDESHFGFGSESGRVNSDSVITSEEQKKKLICMRFFRTPSAGQHGLCSPKNASLVGIRLS